MKEFIRSYALLINLTTTLVVSIVGGLVGGMLFDRFLGTFPLGLLVFSLIGIAAATLSVYRQVTAAIAIEEEERHQGKQDSAQRQDPEREEDD